MRIKFNPQGVCCREMYVDISDDNTINEAVFLGGCSGNLQGIGQLVKGMAVEEAVERLKGIDCGGKGTSCPDQFAKGLVEYLKMAQAGALKES